MSILNGQAVAVWSGASHARGWFDVEIPCQYDDSELWFSATVEGLARAQQLCRPCRLRTECLAGALQRHEPWGVWGGELFEHGVPVARKRPRGRPRKTEQLASQASARALADRLGQALTDGLGGQSADHNTSGTAA